MAKNLTMAMLMDFYGQLLTEKQLSALNMYYNEDLSLSEIADECGISRQGVRDNIKRGEKLLNDYEQKLGLAGRFLEINSGINKMNTIIDSLNTDGNEEQIAALKKLCEVMSAEI